MTTSKTQKFPMSEPLGLCDLIGLAFRIWRQNLGLIFRSLITPTIFYFASTTLLQWTISYGANASSDLPRILSMVGLAFLSCIVFVISLIFLSVRQLALVRLFSGFASTWEQALAYSRKRTLWLVGLFAVTAILSMVIFGILICVIALAAVATKWGPAASLLGAGGIITGIFLLIIAVGLLMVLSLMGFSVLACEDTDFFGVIGRTMHWTFKNFGRVMCFSIIFYVIMSAISLPVSLPVVVLTIADMTWQQIQTGASAAGDAKLSLGVMLFVQFWDGLSSLLLRPVSFISFGLLYLDLRQRNDGLDLACRLQELSAKSGEV